MVTAVKKLIHQSPINEIKTVTKRFLFLKSKFPDFGLCNRRESFIEFKHHYSTRHLKLVKNPISGSLGP